MNKIILIKILLFLTLLMGLSFLLGCDQISKKIDESVDILSSKPKELIRQCFRLKENYLFCRISVLINEGKHPLTELDICYALQNESSFSIPCHIYEKVKKQGVE